MFLKKLFKKKAPIPEPKHPIKKETENPLFTDEPIDQKKKVRTAERYWCTKCNKNHLDTSKIGVEHLSHRGKEPDYWCKECEKYHNPESNIGQRHYGKKGRPRYWCERCIKYHYLDTAIGQRHRENNEEKTYWCKRCLRYHKSTSKTGKEHIEHKGHAPKDQSATRLKNIKTKSKSKRGRGKPVNKKGTAITFPFACSVCGKYIEFRVQNPKDLVMVYESLPSCPKCGNIEMTRCERTPNRTVHFWFNIGSRTKTPDVARISREVGLRSMTTDNLFSVERTYNGQGVEIVGTFDAGPVFDKVEEFFYRVEEARWEVKTINREYKLGQVWRLFSWLYWLGQGGIVIHQADLDDILKHFNIKVSYLIDNGTIVGDDPVESLDLLTKNAGNWEGVDGKKFCTMLFKSDICPTPTKIIESEDISKMIRKVTSGTGKKKTFTTAAGLRCRYRLQWRRMPSTSWRSGRKGTVGWRRDQKKDRSQRKKKSRGTLKRDRKAPLSKNDVQKAARDGYRAIISSSGFTQGAVSYANRYHKDMKLVDGEGKIVKERTSKTKRPGPNIKLTVQCTECGRNDKITITSVKDMTTLKNGIPKCVKCGSNSKPVEDEQGWILFPILVLLTANGKRMDGMDFNAMIEDIKTSKKVDHKQKPPKSKKKPPRRRKDENKKKAPRKSKSTKEQPKDKAPPSTKRTRSSSAWGTSKIKRR